MQSPLYPFFAGNRVRDVASCSTSPGVPLQGCGFELQRSLKNTESVPFIRGGIIPADLGRRLIAVRLLNSDPHEVSSALPGSRIELNALYSSGCSLAMQIDDYA